MTQTELIATLAHRTASTQAQVRRLLEELSIIVAGGTVDVPGLGKFSTAERKGRKGRNPKTGEMIDIPSKTVVTFAPCKKLRDSV